MAFSSLSKGSHRKVAMRERRPCEDELGISGIKGRFHDRLKKSGGGAPSKQWS